MIIGWIRLAVVGYIALTVIYFIMKLYLRSVARERLEKEFDAGGISGNRSDYIETSMIRYDKGLKRNLLWLIYIIPTILVVVTLYIVNFQ